VTDGWLDELSLVFAPAQREARVVCREPAYFARLEACRRELPDNVAYSRRNGCWVATPLPPSVAAANPTAQINGPAVNGIASTYMRSDAAPALEIGDGAVARIAREVQKRYWRPPDLSASARGRCG
jgi:hypothetical protein